MLDLPLSGLNVYEHLKSLWHTLQPPLADKIELNKYVLQDHSDANQSTVRCCFKNMFLVGRYEGWSRAQYL